MFIRYIRVANFRGIDHFEAVMNNNLLSVVGQNDVGKSSVLRAICVFLEKEKMTLEDFPNDDPTKLCEIELHFDNNLSDGTSCENENLVKLKQTFEARNGKISAKQLVYKLIRIPSEEELDDYKILKAIAKTLTIEAPSRKPTNTAELDQIKKDVINKASQHQKYDWFEDDWDNISTYLPEVIFIPASQDHLSEQKMTNDSSLFGRLFRVGLRKWLNVDTESRSAITTINKRIEHINKIFIDKVEEKLKEQLPLAEGLNQDIDPLDISKGFSFTMTVKDSQGIETALNHRGSGLQRSVLVAVIRAQSEINKLIQNLDEQTSSTGSDHIKPTLYIFEEPEAFLHLSAQKELFYSLKDLAAAGSQIIISTHSTLFIDESSRDDIILLTRSNGRTTSLQHIPDEEIKDHLGERVKISELLTGKVCCIVEGISDKHAFESWAERLGLDHRRMGVHFVSMDGCRQLDYFANVKILIDFNVPFRIILDRDSHGETKPEERKKELEQKYPKLKHGYIKVLRKGELENYFCLDTTTAVLKIERNLVDDAAYILDPKKALQDATQTAIERGQAARKYREGEHSRIIASKMPLEILDEEIKSIIMELAELSKGNQHVLQLFDKATSQAAAGN